jgi:hypothetical protein
MMVADFFSAEYGWMHSQDGKHNAHVLFRAGKGREGYFDNESICVQMAMAMDLVDEEYPDKDHVFVFDNA